MNRRKMRREQTKLSGHKKSSTEKVIMNSIGIKYQSFLEPTSELDYRESVAQHMQEMMEKPQFRSQFRTRLAVDEQGVYTYIILQTDPHGVASVVFSPSTVGRAIQALRHMAHPVTLPDSLKLGNIPIIVSQIASQRPNQVTVLDSLVMPERFSMLLMPGKDFVSPFPQQVLSDIYSNMAEMMGVCDEKGRSYDTRLLEFELYPGFLVFLIVEIAGGVDGQMGFVFKKTPEAFQKFITMASRNIRDILKGEVASRVAIEPLLKSLEGLENCIHETHQSLESVWDRVERLDTETPE